MDSWLLLMNSDVELKFDDPAYEISVFFLLETAEQG